MRPVGNALAETTYRPVSPEVKVPQQGTLIPRHHTRGDHRGNVHGLRSDVLWIHDIGRAALPPGTVGTKRQNSRPGQKVVSSFSLLPQARGRPLARHIAEQGETPGVFPNRVIGLVLSIFSEAGQLSQSRFLPALCSTSHGPVNIISVNWRE